MCIVWKTLSNLSKSIMSIIYVTWKWSINCFFIIFLWGKSIKLCGIMWSAFRNCLSGNPATIVGGNLIFLVVVLNWTKLKIYLRNRGLLAYWCEQSSLCPKNCFWALCGTTVVFCQSFSAFERISNKNI